MIRLALPAAFSLLFASAPAFAAPAQPLGQFKQWNAASYSGENGKRCYIVSSPTTEKPESLRHGEVFFFVQTAPNAPARTESSFQTGYDFAKDSTVTVTIGEDSFRMLTSGNNAWLQRLEREGELLAAMKAGDEMVLAARSARGNETSYTFSLEGVTAASKLLERCG
ncbi:invasion associated locus B family protein [Bosea sp. CS1GBMeth4]|uniref:invasion associated locus B family protein n=1 Tax=Bosea sp. CS1GBMeth4 TaxID=1892849 RepID=UPI001645C5C7|nr:invasion associated locus B family protein [Bosea sp. CS1GBMeth4]